MISEYKAEAQQMAIIYNEETEKDFREYINDWDTRVFRMVMEPADHVAELMDEKGYPLMQDDMEHIEHRVETNHYYGHMFDDHEFYREDNDPIGWTPYEQDLSEYPEIYKMYGENFERYERAKKKFMEEDPKEEQGEDAHKK